MESKITYFCASFLGDVAQLVEQRTENPCVGGSIPSITTQKISLPPGGFFFFIRTRVIFSNLA
jgi:hypothetical protein